MRIMRTLGVAAFAAALALPAAAEDLTIVYKVTGRGDKPQTASQYYSASKIRTSDGEHDTILDLAAGRIVSLDNAKKQYSQMTLAEIQASMQQASAQMEEAMKNVPPAMREKMQQMMGGAGAGVGSSIAVTKGGTRSVAGYSCQEYSISMGAGLKSETCNTTALQIPFDPAQFRKMWSFSNPAFMNAMKGASNMTEQLQQIQGLPLAETTSFSLMGRSMTTTKEATEVKKGAVPASVFEIPAGYTEVESPMKAMGRAKRRE